MLARPALAVLVSGNLRGTGREIKEIVLSPAAAVGLAFEEVNGAPLSDEIRRAMVGQPDPLPLPPLLLEQLFAGDERLANWERYGEVLRTWSRAQALASRSARVWRRGMVGMRSRNGMCLSA